MQGRQRSSRGPALLLRSGGVGGPSSGSGASRGGDRDGGGASPWEVQRRTPPSFSPAGPSRRRFSRCPPLVQRRDSGKRGAGRRLVSVPVSLSGKTAPVDPRNLGGRPERGRGRRLTLQTLGLPVSIPPPGRGAGPCWSAGAGVGAGTGVEAASRLGSLSAGAPPAFSSAGHPQIPLGRSPPPAQPKGRTITPRGALPTVRVSSGLFLPADGAGGPVGRLPVLTSGWRPGQRRRIALTSSPWVGPSFSPFRASPRGRCGDRGHWGGDR